MNWALWRLARVRKEDGDLGALFIRKATEYPRGGDGFADQKREE